MWFSWVDIDRPRPLIRTRALPNAVMLRPPRRLRRSRFPTLSAAGPGLWCRGGGGHMRWPRSEIRRRTGSLSLPHWWSSTWADRRQSAGAAHRRWCRNPICFLIVSCVPGPFSVPVCGPGNTSVSRPPLDLSLVALFCLAGIVLTKFSRIPCATAGKGACAGTLGPPARDRAAGAISPSSSLPHHSRTMRRCVQRIAPQIGVLARCSRAGQSSRGLRTPAAWLRCRLKNQCRCRPAGGTRRRLCDPEREHSNARAASRLADSEQLAHVAYWPKPRASACDTALFKRIRSEALPAQEEQQRPGRGAAAGGHGHAIQCVIVTWCRLWAVVTGKVEPPPGAQTTLPRATASSGSPHPHRDGGQPWKPYAGPQARPSERP